MTDYRARAVCRDVDPEAFFPVGDDWTGPANTARAQRAKGVCAVCPVLAECLAEALAIGDEWAIRGGTLPAERRRTRVTARTGTPAPPATRGRGRPRVVHPGRLREIPTPAQRAALLAAVDSGYVPSTGFSSMVVKTLVRDGYADRIPGPPTGRPDRKLTRLTEHGRETATRCAREDATPTCETVPA